jgi:hypothetical protein
MWYIHTIEFYSAIKKNELMMLISKCMELQNFNLSDISQAQKNQWPGWFQEAHMYNLSYSGSIDQEYHSLKQAQDIVSKTLSPKIPSQKMVDGVAQGVGPEFKLQSHKKGSHIFSHM